MGLYYRLNDKLNIRSLSATRAFFNADLVVILGSRMVHKLVQQLNLHPWQV